MERIAGIGAICLSLAFAGGCMVAGVSGYRGDVLPFEAERYDGCMWGRELWEDEWATVKEPARTLQCVRVRSNLLYALATVATLGLWAPVDLEWVYNLDNPDSQGGE